MNEFYLSLGSNLGDREFNLSRAIKSLSTSLTLMDSNHILIENVSSVYESSAMPDNEQPKFLNIALKITSNLDPLGLLKAAKRIEADFGRNLSEISQPRIIDIDIIFMKSMGKHILVDLEEYNGVLQIPHPRLHLRAFVLMPLIEIDSELIHPTLDKTLKEILINLDKQDINKLNSISY
ncbi:2-amino-4-hydroxy-6-hydroxymethyldihydropteridine diphosphokinase [bacterium]|nr:2-amino-4-hydroxy-6-hydroxymethyldihydropteridine diphosphokinase [bacterium]MBT3795511.1 2-amino-4-hydroxy-6-hydroxymethyldihydropteridine diphosphokinase [bacterium]